MDECGDWMGLVVGLEGLSSVRKPQKVVEGLAIELVWLSPLSAARYLQGF